MDSWISKENSYYARNEVYEFSVIMVGPLLLVIT